MKLLSPAIALLIGLVVVLVLVVNTSAQEPYQSGPFSHTGPTSTKYFQHYLEENPATLEEDDPGWDCATMGNKVCGTTSDEGDNDE